MEYDVATLEAAKLAADDDPNIAIHEWDAARPRSSKTADAHGDGQFGVGPSDFGQCQKAIEFRERPPEGYEPVPVSKSAAIIGTLIHDAVATARQSLYPWRRFNVPVTVPGLDRDGEADEYDPIIGRVTDLKTAGSYKWDVVGKYGPPDSEWEQVMTYGLGLEDAGETVNELELLYLNRDSGLWEPYLRPYSRPAALTALSKLHAVMEALEAGDPLPRQRGDDVLLGPTVNTLCARFCPAVKTCWNLDEVPPTRTPEGFMLVPADDDGLIAATLTEYDAARTTATEAKKRQDYAKTLLAGLDPGPYGDHTLRWTGGGPGTAKPDLQGRVEQLEGAIRTAIITATLPPDPEMLPWPTVTKPSSVRIEVKAIRKGTK